MKELRYQPTEFRVAETDGQRTLSGYAAKYNTISEQLFEPSVAVGFREIILPGAFAARTQDDCTLNYEHDDRLGFCGRTISNTLKLTDDDEGLRFDCILPDTTFARDLMVLISPPRQDLRYCSFAFDVGDEEWETMEDGTPLRKIITIAALYDCSIVVRPAYVFDTELSIRSKKFLEDRKISQKTDPHAMRKRLLDLHQKF